VSPFDGALFAIVASYRYFALSAVDSMTIQHQRSMVFDLRSCDNYRVILSIGSYDSNTFVTSAAIRVLPDVLRPSSTLVASLH